MGLWKDRWVGWVGVIEIMCLCVCMCVFRERVGVSGRGRCVVLSSEGLMVCNY